MPSVFLSHNHRDKPFVRLLAARLSEHGVRVWVDEAEIKIGDSLIGKIEDGIQGSDYLAVVLSPHSVGSKWVKEELRAVLALQIATDRMKVLPILIDDCTLPLFLADKLFLDMRGWQDPAVFGVGLSRLLGDIDITTEAVCLLTGMPFLRIPEGAFAFGAPPSKLYLEEFWIGKYPLRVEELALFWRAQKAVPDSDIAGPPDGYFDSLPPDHPATRLDLHTARTYAEWSGYTLATRQQYKKAARGTDGRRYPWGNEWDAAKCNTKEAGIGGTTPVNRYPEGRSPYGCFDMFGNVLHMSAEFAYWGEFSEEDHHHCKGACFFFSAANGTLSDSGAWSAERAYDFIGYRFVVTKPDPARFRYL